MLAEASDADDHAMPSPADPLRQLGARRRVAEGRRPHAGLALGRQPGLPGLLHARPGQRRLLILFTNSDKGLSTYKRVLNLFFGKGDYPAVDWAVRRAEKCSRPGKEMHRPADLRCIHCFRVSRL